MCSCSIYSARYWPISTSSWEDLRKKSLYHFFIIVYIHFLIASHPQIDFYLGSVFRAIVGHTLRVAINISSIKVTTAGQVLWIPTCGSQRGKKWVCILDLREILSDFMDIDIGSTSWCLRSCYRQKSSLFFNRHRFDSWTDTALQNRECFAINLAVSIQAFVWKLSCKKLRSLPLD